MIGLYNVDLIMFLL